MDTKTDRNEAVILIVEDDQFLSEILASKFHAKGYRAVSAYNGQEGLEKVAEAQPDIILLDILMPVLDGYGFLSEIKKLPEYNGIPIIVLSNLGQPDEIARAMELGALHFLVKANFTPEEIYTKVSSIVGGGKSTESEGSE